MDRDLPAVAAGIAWGFLAALCWGASTTLARFGIAVGLTPSDLIFLRFGTSGIVLLPFFLHSRSLAIGGLLTGSGLASAPIAQLTIQVLGQGFCAGVIATIAFSKAIHALGTSRSGLFAAIVPVVALLTGVPLLGEKVTALQLAGCFLVTLGLAVSLTTANASTRKPHRRIKDAIHDPFTTQYRAIQRH